MGGESDYGSMTGWFSGKADEVSLYNRVLSASELAAIYAAGSLGKCSAPQLTIIRSGANVLLTWPTNATGFTLKSTTNLVSSTVWTNVSPAPVVVNGQNTVTNPISGARQFYRLSQ